MSSKLGKNGVFVINDDGTVTATKFNGVALTDSGAANRYLAEDGDYKEITGGGGTDGKGWTNGFYTPATGIVTFESADGLEFVTTDLRGATGNTGATGQDGTNGIDGTPFSTIVGEPTGSAIIGNVVQISKADHVAAETAGTLVATTQYIIKN